MDCIKIKIDKHRALFSIKELLKEEFHVGRSKVEELRNSHSLFLNDVPVSINTKLNIGDILTITFEDEIDFIRDELPIKVVYEDEYLLICDKPSGIIVHPDDKTKRGTLVNMVANYYFEHGIHRKVRFINRLDKDTTGLVLFAKDFLSEAKLHYDIESHNVKRDYLAICLNKFSTLEGTINLPIGKDRHDSKKQVVTRSGKSAITQYKVKKHISKKLSLVELNLKTGRTHQIRVHMAHINHPVLGDTIYGEGGDRLFLHGYRLSLFHPISREYLQVESLPDFDK